MWTRESREETGRGGGECDQHSNLQRTLIRTSQRFDPHTDYHWSQLYSNGSARGWEDNLLPITPQRSGTDGAHMPIRSDEQSIASRPRPAPRPRSTLTGEA